MSDARDDKRCEECGVSKLEPCPLKWLRQHCPRNFAKAQASGEHHCTLCTMVIPNSAQIKECRLQNCPEVPRGEAVFAPSHVAQFTPCVKCFTLEACRDGMACAFGRQDNAPSTTLQITTALHKYRGGPNPVAAALLELVECKDLIDSIDEDFASDTPVLTTEQRNDARAEYKRRKPLAWEEARRVLIEFFSMPSAIAPNRDDIIEECARTAYHARLDGAPVEYAIRMLKKFPRPLRAADGSVKP